MADISHRGFRASVFVRRSRGAWEVMTTIYVPEGLVNEIGDQVIMDVDESTTNRIEHVRSKAFEQAKKAIDEIIAGRVVISLPAK
jgi:LytS/YehU family sensor histidine kinase